MHLSHRWLNLCSSLGAKGDYGISFADLIARYSENWRAYHTLLHIGDMFVAFDEIRSDAYDLTTDFINKQTVEMAIWYHDAVYNTKKHDNEEKSAELFQEIAGYLVLTESFTDKVTQMILATKHSVTSGDLDTQVLSDLDLSILGKNKEIFDEYENQIRREYDWVSDIDFARGRTEVLKSFLNRPNIYSTRFFRKKFEEKARQNLARSIAQLSHRL